jgi:hypothetical protein
MQSESDSDEPSRPNVVSVRDPQRRRSPTQSPALSELNEISPHDDHDHALRRPFQPFRPEASLVPTGLQLERYSQDYSLHVDYLAQYRSGATTEGAFSTAHPFGTLHHLRPDSPHVPPTGVLWSDQEKQTFFGSLARRSRYRPDLISQDLGGSKSESEVGWLIDSLRLLSEIERTKRPDRGTEENSVWKQGFAPCAREVSEDWIEREEDLAKGLIQAESSRAAERREEARRAHFERQMRKLRKLPTYKDIKGQDSMFTKTVSRKHDYQDRLELGQEVLKYELDEDIRGFLNALTGRRLEHLSSALLHSQLEQDQLDRPDLVDSEGNISIETFRSLREVWKADAARLDSLNRVERELWTVHELAEASGLRKKVQARKKELKLFAEWVKGLKTPAGAEETGSAGFVDGQTVANLTPGGESSIEQMAGRIVSVAQEQPPQGKKRKRRQRKVKVKSEEGEGPAKKKSKPNPPMANETSAQQEEPVVNPGSAYTPQGETEAEGKPKIKPRDYLFTREQARPLLSQLYEDIRETAREQRDGRRKQVKKIDAYGVKRLGERNKRAESQSLDVLEQATARVKEKKLDLFNLKSLIPRVRNRESITVESVSAPLLELLHAHLDVFLRRLLLRVIYVGEGHAAARPEIDDDLRLGVNAQVVYTAMEQVGLRSIMPDKENKSRHLEPFPVRHLLPTLPTRDGVEGEARWAEDVVPNVARGIIDPSYGQVILPSGSRTTDGEDDLGLETGDEDEADDELAHKVEDLQDRLDTLRDQEHEDHLNARYNTDAHGAGEVASFGERFDWTVYEADMTYIARLRRNWKVDEGTLVDMRGKTPKGKVGETDSEEKGEEEGSSTRNAKSDMEIDGEDLDGQDEDLQEEQPFDHTRAVEIAQLEKGRSTPCLPPCS